MKFARVGSFILTVGWSCHEMWLFTQSNHFKSLFDASLTTNELSALVYASVILFGLVVFLRFISCCVSTNVISAFREALSALAHKELFFLSAVAAIPSMQSTTVVHETSGEIPVTSTIEPIVAIALVRRLLRRHTQDESELRPEFQLTEASAKTVYQLRQVAATSHKHGFGDIAMNDEELDSCLDDLIAYEPAPLSSVESWDIVLRLYGYPHVESRHGIQAEFGKKRSVEVLAWLGMNLERPRRSAVRTALWDIEISDATFSTVMSDIRRGLSSVITEKNRSEIFPPTFTDSIDIGVGLITDFDLLRQALTRFREDQSQSVLLARELSLIRDTPFAGVNYMWADLDGTTTRMVVLALEAACELAVWARNVGDLETCMIAVKAGLRVMPGHEELLEIQHSFISQRPMSSE